MIIKYSHQTNIYPQKHFNDTIITSTNSKIKEPTAKIHQSSQHTGNIKYSTQEIKIFALKEQIYRIFQSTNSSSLHKQVFVPQTGLPCHYASDTL